MANFFHSKLPYPDQKRNILYCIIFYNYFSENKHPKIKDHDNDDLDGDEIKRETIYGYIILVTAFLLFGFLIWAPTRLYITETPC